MEARRKTIALAILLACGAAWAPQPEEGGFVRRWKVLGPFAYGHPEEGRLDREVAGDESALDASTSLGESRPWKAAATRPDGVLDLRALFAPDPSEHAAAFALAYVLAPSPRWTTLALGSDDGVSLRVNGLLFHEKDVPRGHRFGDDRVRVKLRRGWNRLLFKVVNGAGAFALSARFEEAEGLEFSTDPPPDRWTGAPEPAEIFVRTREAARAVWDGDLLLHRFAFDVANVGGQTVDRASLELRASDVSPNVTWADEDLRPWTRRTAEFAVDLHALLAGSGGIPYLMLDDGAGRRRLPIEGLDAESLLASLYGPFEVPIGPYVAGERSGCRGRVVPPALAAGLDAEVEVRRPEPAEVWVNGWQAAPTADGSTGWFPVGEPAGGLWDLDVRPAPVRTERPRAWIRFRFPEMERARLELRVAREFGAAPEGGAERLLAAATSLDREALAAEAKKAGAEAAGRVDPRVRQSALLLAGNAHVDLAWLWRIPETRRVLRDTFRAALDNMKRYPGFAFSHGQAQSYAWIEEDDPAMFEEIRSRVKEGRWEVVGGTWAESDTNMPTGESLVRQWLQGKRYFAEKLGVDVKVGWMPDTFGHPATLPTIARGCGLDAYVFFRPWEEARTFRWRGPDGSEVLGIRPPRWYMVEADGIDAALGQEARKAGEKTGIDEQVVLVGVGDHGGGPTREAIEKAALYDALEAFPSAKFGRAHDFVARLREKGKVEDAHEGEVNFVFPGCWTSQGDHKRSNRRAEHALPAAETAAALASLRGYEPPRAELLEAWRLTLLNQFHDLLCGSGIDEIYADAAEQYDTVFEAARGATRGALRVLLDRVDTASVAGKDRAFLAWNPLPWTRSDRVEGWVVSEGKPYAILDAEGRALTPTFERPAGATALVSFVARDVPGCGWRTYRIGPPPPEPARFRSVHDLRIGLGFDEAEGRLPSLRAGAERLAGPGGEVRVYEDRGNAWELPIEGPGSELAQRTAFAWGEAEGGTLSGRHGDSLVDQDLEFRDGLGRVDVRVRLDWKDPHRCVKIGWPFALGESKATFEVPFGAIERPADGKEVPAIRWVDVSDANRGVAILNDGRYGFDVRGNAIRITAHRAPTDPGKTAGIGTFEFRYAVVPHEGDWRAAEIPRRAVEFNTPLEPWVTDAHAGEWPAVHSLLSVEGPGVIASAFKMAEEGDALVLRVYEAHGREAQARVRLPFAAKKVEETDHLERGGRDLGVSGADFALRLRPHEVKTLRVSR